MIRDAQPTGHDLRALADLRPPVPSLYVPMTAAVPDTHQNDVRQRHAVERAPARLETRGAGSTTLEAARDALAPLARDHASPAPAERTRAAFWSEEVGLRLHALPFSHDEETRVAPAAALRPNARAARHPGRYRLLALSTHRVALFEGSIHQVVARALEEIIGDDGVPLVLAGTSRHHAGPQAALRREVGLLDEGPRRQSRRTVRRCAPRRRMADRPARPSGPACGAGPRPGHERRPRDRPRR